MDLKKLLQKVVKVQKENMRIALYCGLTLILIGIISSSCFTLLRIGDMDGHTAELILVRLGPLCITGAGAAFPLRSYLAYRVRISTYEYLLDCCDKPDAEKDQNLTEAILEAVKGLLKLE